MEKMASDGPKQGREDFFPTNPDLADILGRTDLNFENCYFFFKQKTAYEIASCLVGSEMCIRDRVAI